MDRQACQVLLAWTDFRVRKAKGVWRVFQVIQVQTGRQDILEDEVSLVHWVHQAIPEMKAFQDYLDSRALRANKESTVCQVFQD